MPVIANGNNQPHAQPAYDGQMGNYAAAQGGYGNGTVEYKSPQMGGGGPPVAGVYTPGNGPQKAGYSGFVPAHSGVADAPPMYGASPSGGSYSYPATTEPSHTGSYSYPAMTTEPSHTGPAEMYGGHPNQGY